MRSAAGPLTLRNLSRERHPENYQSILRSCRLYGPTWGYFKDPHVSRRQEHILGDLRTRVERVPFRGAVLIVGHFGVRATFDNLYKFVD